MHTPSLILKSDIVVKSTTLRQHDYERAARQIAERDDPTIALIGRVLDRFTEEYSPWSAVTSNTAAALLILLTLAEVETR